MKCLLEPPDSQREGIQGSLQEICIILVTNISSKMIDEKNIRFAAILRKSNEPPETQLEGVARKLTRNFHNFMTKISSEEKLNFNLHIYNNIYKSIFYIADNV